MRVDTKTLRNLGFAGMLATMPLAQAKVAALTDCGAYWCDGLCPLEGGGGYLYYQQCDDNSCSGSGCTGGGTNCQHVCTSCGGGYNCA
jgi:hypothetical protein